MKTKKKKTRRSDVKYPSLDPKFNLKTRSDALDCDYLDQLSESEKQYLNDFNNEYVNADFTINVKEGRKRIHKKKKVEAERNRHLRRFLTEFLTKLKEVIQVLNKTPINVTTKADIKRSIKIFKDDLKAQVKKEFGYVKDHYKTDSEKNNNARNACVYTKTKAQNKITAINDLNEDIMGSSQLEDILIAKIDAEREE